MRYTQPQAGPLVADRAAWPALTFLSSGSKTDTATGAVGVPSASDSFAIATTGKTYRTTRSATGGMVFSYLPIKKEAFSLIVLANPTNASAIQSLFSQRAGSGGNNQGFTFGANLDGAFAYAGGAIGVSCQNSAAVTFGARTSGTTYVDGKFHVYGLTRASATAPFRFYFDGVEQTAAQSGTASALASTLQETKIGAPGNYTADAVFSSNCDFALIAAFDGVELMPAQMATLRNPWQLYKSNRSVALMPALAAAVSATSATTDGADSVAASVAPVVGAGSTKTDGADTLAANVAPVVAASSSKTDGADGLAAAAAPVVGSTSTKTDGADSLGANVAPVVAASSATSDAADALASSAAPIIAAQSTTTDAADAVSASGGTAVGLSGSATDGSDTLTANAAPVVGLSGAASDGADVLAASAAPSVSASSAAIDGADVVAASGGATSVIGVSAALTDSADALAVQADPQILANAAAADGADTLSASAGVALSPVSAAVALVDAPDLVAALAGPALDSASGGPDDEEEHLLKASAAGRRMYGKTASAIARAAIATAMEPLEPELAVVAAALPAAPKGAGLASLATVAQVVIEQDPHEIAMLLIMLDEMYEDV